MDAAGSGAYMTALFHGMGLLASFSMGALSDRCDRATVMLALAATSMVCSFIFGWTATWPLAWVLGIGMVYAFSSLGDSPILSAALTETVNSAYLGAALGLRSLLGFGAASLAPLAFGLILDWTNAAVSDRRLYTDWGWAFSALGLGGAGAVWAAWKFRSSRLC
jgi:MFS family permease